MPVTPLLFKIPVDPVPASRPRVGRYGTYYPPKYEKYKKLLGKWFTGQYRNQPITKRVRVSLICSVAQPKCTKLDYPRPDVDNYLKGVLDAMNGIVLADDRQITLAKVSKRWAPKGQPGSMVLRIVGRKKRAK